MKVVVITGNIGCGKTSTIESISCQAEYDTNLRVVKILEDVEGWHWLLKKFYEDKARFVYLLQTMIFTHFIKVAEKVETLRDSEYPPDYVIIERSPRDCLYVFIENVKNLMTAEEYQSLLLTADRVISMYPWNQASYYIIDVPVEVCKERTDRRKRPGEDLIDLGYLENLHGLYARLPGSRIRVDPTMHIALVGEKVWKYITEDLRASAEIHV